MRKPLIDNEFLGVLLGTLPDAVIVLDTVGRLRWANAAAERLFGWSAEDWLGAAGTEFVHPDDLDLVVLSLGTVQEKTVGTAIEVRVNTTRGWRLVEAIGAPVHQEGEEGTVVCLRDLTERRRWEVASDQIAKFRSLVHNAATITMLLSPTGVVEAASGALTRILGHDPEAVAGRPLAHLVSARDQPALAGALRADRSTTIDIHLLRRADRHEVPFELNIVNLLDDPTVSGFVATAHDITRLRVAQHELEELAHHDALTGLPNRLALELHLGRVLPAPADRPVTLAFLDLDRFKPINDLLGHDAGDELLVKLAARLRLGVGPDDFVARLGSDEFVIVAPQGGDPGGPAGMVARLEEAVAEPFVLSAGTVQVFASVGLATATPSHTAELLLSEADAQMYTFKRERRGNPQEPAMTAGARRSLADDLALAIADGQIVVHYQPVVRLQDGAVTGFEALVRWAHPTRGLLRPAVFLGVAEDAGREHELGELVLRTACAHLASMDGDDLTMAVNLSVGQLDGDQFVRMVESVLTDAALSPSRLCLDVAERHLLGRPAHDPSTPVRVTLESLADLGVTLAVDDFGTGFSSLTHVLHFPIDIVKIDRSFVSGVASDRQRRSVVAAVLELSRGMGTTAIAEGIERPEQLAALRELDCPFGQGYLLGRPAAAARSRAQA